MNTIMVQLRDQQWTLQALHLACAMARNQQSNVVLVRMMQTPHMALMGTDLANVSMSYAEARLVKELSLTAEDYGVKLSLQHMQYFTMSEALVEAAELLESKVVFAALPNSFSHWRRLQMWGLQRQLSRRGCQLFSLEVPADKDTKASLVTMKPAKHSAQS